MIEGTSMMGDTEDEAVKERVKQRKCLSLLLVLE